MITILDHLGQSEGKNMWDLYIYWLGMGFNCDFLGWSLSRTKICPCKRLDSWLRHHVTKGLSANLSPILTSKIASARSQRQLLAAGRKHIEICPQGIFVSKQNLPPSGFVSLEARDTLELPWGERHIAARQRETACTSVLTNRLDNSLLLKKHKQMN